MQRLILTLAGLCVCSCSSLLPPEVIGSHADSITRFDAQEIKLLVASRHDIAKPVNYIHALAPDRVYVETGHGMLETSVGTTFTARKRNGHWIIDERSVEQMKYIITS